ncbi:non-ribosomal peptide synthetase [[Flexibacter] sp. ATCC 35208]|uniref:non-ribosomal peptide synthetase n=1 Tax=[Flexibacter] sp. ATCC 35208 TaxID=1936242 RepID=UPI0009C1FB7E|nr:non-ribosomal peptide synthetase [[Flexibacter] sp. ATCC 35208]AQX14461.1 SQ 28,332 NRPS biosynthetic scaffold 2 [[Flexibacter] sp. ATCC 35208]OMP77243.1 hypothetical protein BW716_20705 [[Flexibacter] sp. ATCC 35208]
MLTKENIKDIYALSSMQEGILFHALMDDGTGAYFQQSAFRITGDLQIAAVEAALQQLVNRHDALRTVFKYGKVEVPLQIVLKQWVAPFTYKDLRNVTTPTEKEIIVKAFKVDEKQRNFDLSKDALIRVAVLQTEDNSCELIWSYHHIMMDGWSLRILMSELVQLYTAIVKGIPIALPPAQPFSNYIKWLGSINKEEARTYWQQYLKDYDETLTFPGRKPAAQQQPGYLRRQERIALQPEFVNGLRAMAVKHHTTLFTLLQVIWGTLLSKLTGQRKVVFGVVVAGRPAVLERVEQMVGLFINTIPVCLEADPSKTFEDLLDTANAQLLQNRNYDYYPFGEIVSLSPLKKHLLDHILVMIEFPEIPLETTERGHGLEIALRDTFEQTNYDLCVDILAGKTLSVEFTYNEHAFEGTFMKRVAAMFKQLLEQVLHQPATQIAGLSVFTPADQAMVNIFNNSDVPLLSNASIIRIIEQHAASTPDRIAISNGTRHMTYARLNAAVNQLAQQIQQTVKLEKDDRVGILMERSENMLISILAVWKCNAAYIPLDVTYPEERILVMLDDAKARMVLTANSLDNPGMRQALQVSYNVIDLDATAAARAVYNDINPATEIMPGDLAYVIYTSGSTGKPKGAMVEHAGMMNHLYAKVHDLELTADSRIVQNASHCFDISVWQFLAALVPGGMTLVYDRNLVLNPAALLQQVAAEKVTILELVPSYLSILLNLIEEGAHTIQLPDLRYLIMTGETLKPALVNRWFMLYPGIPMVNAYGPTEAADDITHYKISGPLEVDNIPVGYPVQNMKIYIVNEQLQQCPIGIKGEIMVSGVGVGRGYINDKVKTTGAFMNDPFRNDTSVRLYKTGDVGRYLESGAIEFFGRKDYQVKVRGFRIELEEIEKTITFSPFVQDAVVIDKQAPNGDTYLSAYVVAKDGYDVETLRNYMSARLPDYMIPAYFTVIPALPVTANGKTDRAVIRAIPESIPEVKQGEYLAPRTETEEKLAAIWQDVLKMDRIGIRDNFFDLGGDSFKAIRIVSRFGKAFLVPDLYKHPTIEQLAVCIEQNSHGSLQLLYELTPADQKNTLTIIGIPNSAGDPLIYDETTKALLQFTNEIGVYGVSLPRPEPGPGETVQSLLVQLASDIMAEIKKRITTPVIIYGQCNGIGLALELGRQLQDEGVPIQAICTGGALPRTRPVSENDSRTDDELVDFLEGIDATFPQELEDQLIFFRNLKYDGVLAKASFNYQLGLMKENKYRLLKAPFYVVVGDRDPITKGYENRYLEWKMYAEKVVLVEMADVGHFMWRDKPEELAAILYEIAEGRYVEKPVKKKKWSLFN